MKNWPYRSIKGKIEIREATFPSLRNNPLNDPFRRPVAVYLPPGYKPGKKKYPFIVALAGFLGTGLTLLNRDPLNRNLIEHADALIAKGIPPFLLVCPDGFTRYGGSQYVNSSATGNYEFMITRDLIPWIEKEYSVFPGGGILGHSSGGYGALLLSMRNPGLFKAVACHAGDLYFELCYKRDFPLAVETFRRYGSVEKFLKGLRKSEKLSGADISALNIVAMSACYSPNPLSPDGFDLPFEPLTAELREEIWKKWLRHDPVNLIKKYEKSLKKLKLLFFDCGSKDEYFLHFGARIFAKKLKETGIRHIYQEFPSSHRGNSHRYAISLPLLAKALQH